MPQLGIERAVVPLRATGLAFGDSGWHVGGGSLLEHPCGLLGHGPALSLGDMSPRRESFVMPKQSKMLGLSKV